LDLHHLLLEDLIVDWDAGWMERKYPLDMRGFAFHSSLIRENFAAGDIWKHKGVAGETQFIEQLINDKSELEVLMPNANHCLVWHNDLLN